jgi:DNA-binding HxlR family transcriptional regulator
MAQERTVSISGHTDVPSRDTAHLFGGGVAHFPASCAEVSKTLSLVGDKWTVLTIMLLARGPRRFNDIKRTIGTVSQRMLTLTLRGLERDGLVKRTVHPTTPPSVVYELTAMGHSLREPIEALGQWVFRHQRELEMSRAAYDGRSETRQS